MPLFVGIAVFMHRRCAPHTSQASVVFLSLPPFISALLYFTLGGHTVRPSENSGRTSIIVERIRGLPSPGPDSSSSSNTKPRKTEARCTAEVVFPQSPKGGKKWCTAARVRLIGRAVSGAAWITPSAFPCQGASCVFVWRTRFWLLHVPRFHVKARREP